MFMIKDVSRRPHSHAGEDVWRKHARVHLRFILGAEENIPASHAVGDPGVATVINL